MQNSDIAWKILGWGLGPFQRYHLKPVIKSINDEMLLIDPNMLSDNRVNGGHSNKCYLTQGENVEIGLIISCISENNSKDEISLFDQFKNKLQLDVNISHNNIVIPARGEICHPKVIQKKDVTHVERQDINDSLQQSTYQYRMSTTKGNYINSGEPMRGHDGKMFVSYYICTNMMVQVSDIYCNESLSIDIQLSVCMPNTIPGLNGHSHSNLHELYATDTDSSEVEVRALLSSHRFQPPRIPPRNYTIPHVVIQTPITCNHWSRVLQIGSDLGVESNASSKTIMDGLVKDADGGELSVYSQVIYMQVNNTHPYRAISIAKEPIFHVNHGFTVDKSGVKENVLGRYKCTLSNSLPVGSGSVSKEEVVDMEKESLVDGFTLMPGDSYVYAYKASVKHCCAESRNEVDSNGTVRESPSFVRLNIPYTIKYYHDNDSDHSCGEALKRGKVSVLSYGDCVQFLSDPYRAHSANVLQDPSTVVHTNRRPDGTGTANTNSNAIPKAHVSISIYPQSVSDEILVGHPFKINIALHNHCIRQERNLKIITNVNNAYIKHSYHSMNYPGIDKDDAVQSFIKADIKCALSDVFDDHNVCIFNKEEVDVRQLLPNTTTVIDSLEVLPLAAGLLTLSQIHVLDLDTQEMLPVEHPLHVYVS